MSGISINVSNLNAGKQYIVVFQKPQNTAEMFDTLFPIAWKILPLNDRQKQGITYPVELEIMVKESAPSYDAKDRGTVKETPVGQLWEFAKDGDFTDLKMVPGKTVDGLVGCLNKCPQYLDIGIAKNGTPLVVKRRVAQEDRAQFKLTPKLYFAYVYELQEGELIKSDISANKLYELDLTNLKSIDIELSADGTTGKKSWKASNRVAAS